MFTSGWAAPVQTLLCFPGAGFSLRVYRLWGCFSWVVLRACVCFSGPRREVCSGCVLPPGGSLPADVPAWEGPPPAGCAWQTVCTRKQQKQQRRGVSLHSHPIKINAHTLAPLLQWIGSIGHWLIMLEITDSSVLLPSWPGCNTPLTWIGSLKWILYFS